MRGLYVSVLLTALVFVSEETEKTFSNDEVMEMMRTLQERMAFYEEETRQLREDNRALRTKVDVFETWVHDRQMDAESMFFATISAESVSTVDGEPIVFDTADINPGGHYNTLLGMYTAPVHGYYQFSVSKHGNSYHGTFFLLVDEERYAMKEAYFYNSDGTPSGFVTINMELRAGQIVRVENYGSTTVYGTDSTFGISSWFTGHLLYAL